MKTQVPAAAPFITDTIGTQQSVPILNKIEGKDPLSNYLIQVQKIPLLDPAQEIDLTWRYCKTGDIRAAGKLIAANLKLVIKIALEYHHRWCINLVDLIREGNFGLLQAVEKFDPLFVTRFSVHAAYWIKASILQFILDNWQMMKTGSTWVEKKLFFNLHKEKNRLQGMGIYTGPSRLPVPLDATERQNCLVAAAPWH